MIELIIIYLILFFVYLTFAREIKRLENDNKLKYDELSKKIAKAKRSLDYDHQVQVKRYPAADNLVVKKVDHEVPQI